MAQTNLTQPFPTQQTVTNATVGGLDTAVATAVNTLIKAYVDTPGGSGNVINGSIRLVPQGYQNSLYQTTILYSLSQATS